MVFERLTSIPLPIRILSEVVVSGSMYSETIVVTFPSLIVSFGMSTL